MVAPLLIGIDEGTTAVKAVLYDERLQPLREARRRKVSRHPHPGWVEQDPIEILDSVVDAVAELLADAPGEVVGCGLDHQGESVLAWDAATGEPLSPVIVWQDKRQTELLPAIADAEPIASWAGLRPAGRGVNYLIRRAGPDLINVAAIRSTGLTASLGIAEYVADMIAPGVPERPLPAVRVQTREPWWHRS